LPVKLNDNVFVKGK